MGYAYPIDSKVVTNPNGTIDYDRASNSSQLRGLIKSMITNGVNLTESTNLQVMADEETMNLVVKPGYVIIEGALKHFEDDVKVTIGAADTTNPRIDTVVARLNLNEDVRDIVIDILQGTPNVEPVAPELTRTTSYYEVGLADIIVEVGASQISQEVVIDTRLLNSRCGLATAIGEIDTETLFVQLTTDFDNWFEGIKDKLGDDVAGNLQLQITENKEDIQQQLNEHTTLNVTSEEGSHGLRYFDGKLEVQEGEEYTEIKPITLKTADNDYGITGIEFKQEKISTNDRIWKSQATLPTTMRGTGYVTALVYEDEIHLFGGGSTYNDFANSTRHYKLTKGTTNSWASVSTLPEYARTATFFIHDDKIHMVTSSGYYKYDNGSWTQITTVTVPYTTAFMWEDGLHVINYTYSSSSSSRVNSHYRYNGDGWVQVNVSCPGMDVQPRQCTFHDGEFHMLGSCNSSSGVKYHYKWDGEAWTSVSTLWGEWYGGNAISYKGNIHLIGGYGYSNNYTSHYILNGTNWVKATTLPYNFGEGAATIYDNVVHIIGSTYDLSSQKYTNAMSHYYLTANSYTRNTDITLLKEDGTVQFNNNGWTKLTKGTSDTTVYLPTNFKEIYVEDVASGKYVGQVIPRGAISSSSNKMYNLYFSYSSSGNSTSVDIKVGLDCVTLYSASGNVYFR